MRDVREKVWHSLSKYLDDTYKEFVYKKFDSCFDYSPVSTWNTVIADIVIIMRKREEWKLESCLIITQVQKQINI